MVMASSDPPILIIGAGVLGLSTAWHLTERGARVLVIDRERIADGASCGNAGLICFGHPPLTRPGVSIQGLKWMFDKRSPLYIKPRLDGELLRWMWSFHRHCNKRHFDRCMDVLCALGGLSAKCFDEMLDATSIDCDWRHDGWDDVCMFESTLDHAEAEAAHLEPFGYRAKRIDGETLRAESPAWKPGIAGAIRYEDSATMNPGAFTAGLARELVARGVELRSGCTVAGFLRDGDGVTGVRLDTGEEIAAPHTVLTAGVWSDALARSLNLRIPMQPARGYHRDLGGLAHVPRLGCVLNETFIAVTPFHDTLRLAGTLEIAGFNAPWLKDRLSHLTDACGRYLEGVDEAEVTSEWAGYRPCTPDGLPAIGGVSSHPGLFVATGHAMMGMTLGPGSGKLLAEAILGEKPSYASPMLSPSRF
jgi:D-amino-acid dehydrogenase